MKDKIRYDGLEKQGKVYFIKFKNERDQGVKIPIDEISANRISVYLEKIALKDLIMFDIRNDEPFE